MISLTKNVFGALTLDNILQPYIGERDFRSSNEGDGVGYNIHNFDIQYQKNFESAQPVKVEITFDGVIPAGIYGYVFVLTNKLVSIWSVDKQYLI